MKTRLVGIITTMIFVVIIGVYSKKLFATVGKK